MKRINTNYHVYLLFFFILVFPFQTRKVVLTKYSFYSGSFTEYGTFFIYLSDIILLTAILCLIFDSLVVKKRIYFFPTLIHCLLSKIRKIYLSVAALFKLRLSDIRKFWLILAIFIIWLALNMIINRIFIEIELYQTLKIIEFILLVALTVLCLNKRLHLDYCLVAISVSGFLQSIIAIYQFLFQKSLFGSSILHKLTGEAILSADTLGAAKIIYDGEKILRAYGTFPHPNLLGGFLILTIGISIYNILYNRQPIMSSIIYKNTLLKMSQVYLGSIFWILIISIQFYALVISFSRSAWLAFILFIVALLLGLYSHYKNSLLVNNLNLSDYQTNNRSYINEIASRSHTKIVSRETLYSYISRLFNNYVSIISKIVSRETILVKAHIEILIKNLSMRKKRQIRYSLESGGSAFRQIYANSFLDVPSIYQTTDNIKNFRNIIIILLTAIYIFINYYPLIYSRFNEKIINNSTNLPFDFAVTDRIFYNNVSRETIVKSPYFGSGLGTNIFQINEYMRKYFPNSELSSWQYQPNHILYFLISSEIGLVGLLIFLLLIIYTLKIAYQSIFNVCICSNMLINNVSRETLLNISNLNFSNKTINKYLRTCDHQQKNVLAIFLFAILCSYMLIGLFDHYLWTLQQGRIMFWLVISLIIAQHYGNK